MEIRRAVASLALLMTGTQTVALELIPDKVRADLGRQAVDITVIEPHARDAEARVTYVGIPLRAVLERYFADEWAGFQGDIHFLARDRYLAAIEAGRVRSQDAYLTFARADGGPFVIDNRLQNERDVPLDPFYLVWDNIRQPGLRKDGAYGWPYQVVDIRLVPTSAYEALLPENARPEVRQGFVAYKHYCMNCHHIGGIGGRKVEGDMRQLIAGKPRDVLWRWIDAPRAENPGTGMPALNENLSPAERTRLIGRIIDFLRGLKPG